MKIKILFTFILLMYSFSSFCQPTPPITHGNNVTTTPPQSAPIGTSTVLLISLGAIYTSVKIYSSWKNSKEEN